MEKAFYMHIDSENLVFYYSCACIKPCAYFADRKEDAQAKMKHFLLLSSKRYANNNDCSLEIVLTEQEKLLLIKSKKASDIFLFQKPLPISRVKTICFQSEKTKDKIVTLINASSAFIPKELVKVITDKDVLNYSGKEDFFSGIKISDNFSEQIRQYNSLLGCFALMRLSHNGTANYPENYFSTLSRFNSNIENDLRKENREISKIYWDAFEGKDSFKSLLPYLNKRITKDDLYEIARIEGQQIQERSKLSGIIDINPLNNASYIVAVLYTYGLSDEGRSSKVDELVISNFKNGIKEGKSEVVSLCYGLNRGYAAFSNEYKGKVVKFKLNSRLDYYIIESIYQYAFNHISQSSTFPYIDSWCPKNVLFKTKLRRSEYLILDTIISGEKIEVGSTKWWSNIRQFFFQKNNENVLDAFMLRFFEKVKQDIDEEIQEIIEQNSEKIVTLTKESIAQLYEIDDLKKQVELLNNKLRTIESEVTPLVVKEDATNYVTNQSNYNQAFVEARELIDYIAKKSTSKEIKLQIKTFYNKHPFF